MNNTTLTPNQQLIAKEFEKDLELLRCLCRATSAKSCIDDYLDRIRKVEVEYMRYIMSCQKENKL